MRAKFFFKREQVLFSIRGEDAHVATWRAAQAQTTKAMTDLKGPPADPAQGKFIQFDSFDLSEEDLPNWQGSMSSQPTRDEVQGSEDSVADSEDGCVVQEPQATHPSSPSFFRSVSPFSSLRSLDALPSLSSLSPPLPLPLPLPGSGDPPAGPGNPPGLFSVNQWNQLAPAATPVKPLWLAERHLQD